MAHSVETPPGDRVKIIEQELTEMKAKLRQTTGQVGFLQILVLLFVAAVGGGGYFLAKEGLLRIEGFFTARWKGRQFQRLWFLQPLRYTNLVCCRR